MIETLFSLGQSDQKLVEKIVMDENLNYIHMIFQNGDGLPEHFSNSTVYMTVLRGRLTIQLDEQTAQYYQSHSLLKIPEGTKMNVRNTSDELLELIVIKAPAPKS